MNRAKALARLHRHRQSSLEAGAASRAEAAALDRGIDETVGLSQARGVCFEREPLASERHRGVYRRQVGLDWMAKKGRLSSAQRTVGERYGYLYRRVTDVGGLGSSLARAGGEGRGVPLADVVSQAEARAMAQQSLQRLRARLGHQRDLVGVCDRICGQELTPREVAATDREAMVLEAVLKVALDLLEGGSAP